MMRVMLKSKIHRATVTQADLHYVGSISIDRALMDDVGHDFIKSSGISRRCFLARKK